MGYLNDTSIFSHNRLSDQIFPSANENSLFICTSLLLTLTITLTVILLARMQSDYISPRPEFPTFRPSVTSSWKFFLFNNVHILIFSTYKPLVVVLKFSHLNLMNNTALDPHEIIYSPLVNMYVLLNRGVIYCANYIMLFSETFLAYTTILSNISYGL